MKTTDIKNSWLFLPSCDLFVITFHNEIIGSTKKNCIVNSWTNDLRIICIMNSIFSTLLGALYLHDYL